jgi:siroheme synthase
LEAGKSKEAFGVISNGSLDTEKVITGNARSIFKLAQKEKIKAPAIIVIGNVVKLKDKSSILQSILSYN